MTHRKTGLKYLGQTKRDLSTYNGSGRYWNRHLNVHGYDIEKVTLHESTNKSEIDKLGIYYSELWNIVKAVDENGKKIWANEKPESGNGGNSPLIVAKIRESKKRNGTLENNPEIIEKIKKTKEKNGSIGGLKSELIYNKWKNTMLENRGTLNRNSPESIEKAKQTRLRNGTSLDTLEIKEKIRQTKIKNNSFNQNNPKSIALRKETKNKTFIKRHQHIVPLVLELYNNGNSKYKIGKLLNTSYNIVCTILRKKDNGLI
jgi:hypothetical protein